MVLRRPAVAGAAVAMLLVYLASVFLIGRLPSGRLDLTEHRLFTLSAGSKRILAEAKDPVTLTLYYSDKEARPYPQFRQYADRVIEKIGEYAAQSDGKVRFVSVDPEPFSTIEDQAIIKGILPVPLEDGSGPLYFGLTAETGKTSQSIGFVKPESEQYLEYELSKLIQTLQRTQKPRVTLVSELPVSGNNNPQRGDLAPSWVIYRMLSERYQVEQLSPVGLSIPDDTDVLWVMHPEGWPIEALNRIRAFIEAGRHAVILVDPNAESVPALPPGAELALNSLYPVTGLQTLFGAWGIGFNPDQVVLDSKYAWLMQLDENQFPKRNPALLSLPPQAMNQNDPATAALDRIVLSSAGALTLEDESPLKIEPLLQSSDASRLISTEDFRRAAEDPESLLNGFVATQEPFVLAARFTGKLGKSGNHADFIVVADTDFISDRLWVVENNLFGQPVFNAQASNGDFFFNMIDQLSGSDNLISIRSRGKVSRPFDKVDQIRRSAELEYRNRQVVLLAELEKTQTGINTLQQGAADKAPADPAYSALLERKIALRRDLRRIQRNLNEDVENLGRTVKLLNIFAIPLLLVMLGVFLAVRRRYFIDHGRARHGPA